MNTKHEGEYPPLPGYLGQGQPQKRWGDFDSDDEMEEDRPLNNKQQGKKVWVPKQQARLSKEEWFNLSPERKKEIIEERKKNKPAQTKNYKGNERQGKNNSLIANSVSNEVARVIAYNDSLTDHQKEVAELTKEKQELNNEIKKLANKAALDAEEKAEIRRLEVQALESNLRFKTFKNAIARREITPRRKTSGLRCTFGAMAMLLFCIITASIIQFHPTTTTYDVWGYKRYVREHEVPVTHYEICSGVEFNRLNKYATDAMHGVYKRVFNETIFTVNTHGRWSEYTGFLGQETYHDYSEYIENLMIDTIEVRFANAVIQKEIVTYTKELMLAEGFKFYVYTFHTPEATVWETHVYAVGNKVPTNDMLFRMLQSTNFKTSVILITEELRDTYGSMEVSRMHDVPDLNEFEVFCRYVDCNKPRRFDVDVPSAEEVSYLYADTYIIYETQEYHEDIYQIVGEAEYSTVMQSTILHLRTIGFSHFIQLSGDSWFCQARFWTACEYFMFAVFMYKFCIEIKFKSKITVHRQRILFVGSYFHEHPDMRADSFRIGEFKHEAHYTHASVTTPLLKYAQIRKPNFTKRCLLEIRGFINRVIFLKSVCVFHEYDCIKKQIGKEFTNAYAKNKHGVIKLRRPCSIKDKKSSLIFSSSAFAQLATVDKIGIDDDMSIITASVKRAVNRLCTVNIDAYMKFRGLGDVHTNTQQVVMAYANHLRYSSRNIPLRDF